MLEAHRRPVYAGRMGQWKGDGLPADNAKVHARNPRWEGPLCRYQDGVEDDMNSRGIGYLSYLLTSEHDAVTCGQCLSRLGRGPKRVMPGQAYVMRMKRQILGATPPPPGPGNMPQPPWRNSPQRRS